MTGTKFSKDFTITSFTTSSIHIENDTNIPITTKNNLLSGEGNSLETSNRKAAHSSIYVKEEHLYTITLNYCAAPGLIAVGVLPKPPPPRAKGIRAKNYVTNIVSVKRNRNGSEILELEDNDSDSDSDDSDSVGDDENKSSKNKIPAVNRRPQRLCQRKDQ